MVAYRGFIDGGIGDPGGSSSQGGSGPPPPSPGPQPANPQLLTSTGGLAGIFGQVLLPLQDMITGAGFFYVVDPTNFNTEEDCTYFFRVETIKEGQFPTIERIRIRYRDIGKVTVTFNVTGYTRDGDYKTYSKTVTFGTDSKSGTPSFRIRTTYVDIQATLESPQIVMQRAANAGPLCIIAVTPCIRFGDGSQQ